MTPCPALKTALLAIACLACAAAPAFAAGSPPVPSTGGAMRLISGVAPDGHGGGPLEPPRDLITDAQREEIRRKIDENLELLRREGRLVTAALDAPPQLGWPLRIAAGLSDPGHHGISNLLDQDARYPDFVLDYNCGARSYDTSDGYNHQGTDIYTWPWWWWKMDHNEVEVVAAAPGQIINRSDGNFDRSCSFNSNPWNAVYVRHGDGSIAWYGHMKNGSLTKKQVGDSVAEGEFLGVVGSSGNSTGPHLHFEVHDSAGRLIDPWQGTCNSLNADSWWRTQRGYYDSAVNRVSTGALPPIFPSCSQPESPNGRVTFSVGPLVYFTTYYRDQLISQTSRYTIYRPNGSIYSQWSHNSDSAWYSSSWWYWSFNIPSAEAQGTWRFTVEYLSRTYERQFTIGSPAACGSVPQYAVQGEQLRVRKSGSQVRLNWGASCNPQDTDYVVYEGVLGNFSSHTPVLCTTSGAREVTMTPAVGGRYYLVGPRNASREGSLGVSSSGAERPAGVSSCLPRLALQCP